MTANNTYWLPKWWDLPTPGYRRHRILMTGSPLEPDPGGVNSPAPGAAMAQTPPTAVDITGGSPPGPPPAAAAAVQVSEEELRAIKRRRIESRHHQ
mgnify:CR=1 FL=1